MLTLSIKLDTRQLEARLGAAQKQLRFATARTLTRVAPSGPPHTPQPRFRAPQHPSAGTKWAGFRHRAALGPSAPENGWRALRDAMRALA